jgi:hypothetical protein
MKLATAMSAFNTIHGDSSTAASFCRHGHAVGHSRCWRQCGCRSSVHLLMLINQKNAALLLLAMVL